MTSPKKWYKKKSRPIINTENVGSLNGLYAAVIIVHIVDWVLFKFAINVQTIIARVLMYFLLTVIAHFSLKNDNILETLREFWFLILLPTLIIPLLAEWLAQIPSFSIYIDTFSAFFLAIPVWIIYLNRLTKGVPHKERGLLMNLSHKYIAILAIFAVINLIVLSSMSFAQVEALQTTGMDFSISWNTFKEFMIDTWDAVKTAFNQTTEEFKRKTLGVTYRGTVEKAKEKTGLEVKSFSTIGQKTKFVEGETIELLATIDARQLDRKTEIELSCYIEETSAITHKKKTIPGTIIIAGNSQNDNVLVLDEYKPRETISCRVPLTETNMSGRYQGVLVGTLDYESTAAVRYYFMDFADARALKDQGKNVNSFLNIPLIPWSESSNGPLVLRMSPDTVSNPILLNKEHGSSVPVALYLDGGVPGSTARSKSGKIVKMNSVELYVPEELSNLDCLTGNKGNNDVSSRIDSKTKYTVFSYKTNIQNSYTFEHYCYAAIDASSVEKLLPEQNSLTDAYIFGNVDYTYEFKRLTVPFNVVRVGPS